MLLDGKVALVTGGGQGIGAGIVRCMAQEGAKVAILDIATGPGEELAAEISAAGGIARYWHVDVTDLKSFEKTANEVNAHWGSVDILVNNAGIVAPPGPFVDSDPADWDRMIAVDFKGVLHGIRACVPHMQRGASGVIVNIGSDSARFGEPGIAIYTGCKGAVHSVSKSIAKELASLGIRVNVISPGIIETPIIDVARSTPEGAEMIAATLKTIPFQRMGTPKEIGDAAVFLASDKSTYITGQTMSLNGGMLMIG